MITQIRYGVFETNSSSSHSLSVSKSRLSKLMIPAPNENGALVVRPLETEFGWGVEKYTDFATKAFYCYVSQQKNKANIKALEASIKEVTKAESIEWPHYGTSAHIDHQSEDCADFLFDDIEHLKKFLFNKDSILHIDNDNH